MAGITLVVVGIAFSAIGISQRISYNHCLSIEPQKGSSVSPKICQNWSFMLTAIALGLIGLGSMVILFGMKSISPMSLKKRSNFQM